MPFTAEQLSYAGKLAMDYIVKQKPVDLYNQERPLLKLLRSKQKSFPGGKQYVQEKLRTTNDSNFQWFGPDNEVSYNRKRTLAEANFEWRSWHDGFALTEEELLQNYITMTDDRGSAPTTDEQRQLVNIITENTETLREGASEKFDIELHLDGTQDPDGDALEGLDHLVSTTPAAPGRIVGGIDASATPLWQNYAMTGIGAGAGVLIAAMETAFRSTTRRGGRKPDIILAGSAFIDAYRADAYNTIERHVVVSGRGGTAMDAGGGDLTFRGIPIVWDPVFEDLDAMYPAADPDWTKRAYMLNSSTLRLRPAEGQDMVVRRPPRAYNRYTHYWGLTWRGAMTITRPSANAVLAIA